MKHRRVEVDTETGSKRCLNIKSRGDFRWCCLQKYLYHVYICIDLHIVIIYL